MSAELPVIVLAVDEENSKDAFNFVYDDPLGLISKDIQLNIVHAVKEDKDKPKGLELLKQFETKGGDFLKDRLTVHTKLLHHKDGVAQALKAYTDEIQPKLLVVGSSRMNTIKRHLLGSVSDFLQHNCQCPVVIIKNPHVAEGKTRTKPLHVAIAIDHNVHSDNAVDWFLSEVNMPKKSTMVLLHVVKKATEKPEARKYLASFKPKCIESKKDFTMKSGLVYFKGKKPSESIIKYCHDYGVDLLVVASRMQSALIRGLKGSVSDDCVHHAECDVMVWKDERTPRLSTDVPKTTTDVASELRKKETLDSDLDSYDVAMMEMAYAQAGYDKLEPLSPTAEDI